MIRLAHLFWEGEYRYEVPVSLFLSGAHGVYMANVDNAHLFEIVRVGFPSVKLLCLLSPLYTLYSLLENC